MTRLMLTSMGGSDNSSPPPPPPSSGATIRTALEARLNPATYGGRVFTVGTDASTVVATLALADAASSAGNWSLVQIPPGTYNERVSRPFPVAGAYTDVRSTTLNPADVIIDAPDDTNDTWAVLGSPGVLAGVTLRSKGNKSAVHCGNSAGFAAPSENIFWRVVGTQAGTSNDAFSWGICANQRVFTYDCTWNGVGANRVVYVHNFPPGTGVGQSILVMDNDTITGPAGGGYGGVLEENSGNADIMHILGGSSAADLFQITFLGGVTTGSWTGTIDPAYGVIGPGITGVTLAVPDYADIPKPLRLAAYL